jgi:hypothetical protein
MSTLPTRDLLYGDRHRRQPTALETLVKSAEKNAGMRIMLRRCLENIGWSGPIESFIDDRRIV